MKSVWVAGQYKATIEIQTAEDRQKPIAAWSLCGVFSSEEKAKEICRDRTFFYGEHEIDRDITDIDLDNVIYPHE